MTPSSSTPGPPGPEIRASEDPEILELRARWERGHRALAEAIPLAAGGWDVARAPGPGETEVWTPQQVVAHAVGADLRFARMVAQAAGLDLSFAPGAAAEPGPGGIADAASDPAAAEMARRSVQAAVAPLWDALRPAHLDAPTDFADEVRGVLRIAGWHLRDHAQQMLGVRDAR